MNEAVFKKDDPIAFLNQIELIHQEIQTILGILQPYDDRQFSEIMSQNLTTGLKPLIPQSLGLPQVHLKTSGMHAMMSVVSSVEQQKGVNHLNIVILQDSYYEGSECLVRAQAYTIRMLNGDVFNTQGIEAALPRRPDDKPIDLFVGEFHHNISFTRQVYRKEMIKEQIKEMLKRGWVAEKFTVLLDVTMDLERSDEIRNLLADPEIQQLIKDGRMNVALTRSAQKFDMLGMDNYSGGVVIAVNNGVAFGRFNDRMALPEDQLKGLSYQGLTHLQKYAGPLLEEYRKGILANTHYLYFKLPRKSIFVEGTTNPMQISRIEDPRLVYLDIKLPQYPIAAEAMHKKLDDICEFSRLPITHRPSFGFATTNFTMAAAGNLRLSVGLDSQATLDLYARFFKRVQGIIDQIMRSPNIDKDLQIGLAIKSMCLSSLTEEPLPDPRSM